MLFRSPRATDGPPQCSAAADFNDEVDALAARELAHLDVPLGGLGVVHGLKRGRGCIRVDKRLEERGASSELRGRRGGQDDLRSTEKCELGKVGRLSTL